MLKAKLNKICHFYDFNSGTLFLNQSQQKVTVPDDEMGTGNTLRYVKKWAVDLELINADDKVMLA